MIFVELFLTFFKIGLFTFGGGYAMLPLIQSEVLEHGWITAEELVDFIAVSESTPGPFAINISTYVGIMTGGIPGALCATLGVVLPSFLVILIVAHFYEKFKESKTVKGCMSGLKPAVIGLITAAILSVGKTVFNGNVTEMIISAVLFAAMSYLSIKKVHPILIITISATVGILSGIIFCL